MKTNIATQIDSEPAKSMLTPRQLSARTGVPVETLQLWRTRRYAGEDVGPKFVKLSTSSTGSINGRCPVRYMLIHVQEWERSLAENAA